MNVPDGICSARTGSLPVLYQFQAVLYPMSCCRAQSEILVGMA
jgi:hypothetical protein